MKLFKCLFMVLALSLGAFAQASKTEDLGMGAFANPDGAIKLAVDAGLVNLEINSPYVMFVLYMAANKENQNLVVDRAGVTLIYNGQEYKMPSLEELRKNYKGEIHDVNLYRHLGKEGLIASWMRFYDFPLQGQFFPTLTLRSQLPRDEGSMYNFTGFRTTAYFKNPGLKRGDKLTIRVAAKGHPDITGEVEVALK